jgi:hypothetical protein
MPKSQPQRRKSQEFPDLKYPTARKSQNTIRMPNGSDPLALAGKSGRGSVETNWADINWTFRKIAIVSLCLGTPYLILILVTLALGMKVITGVLLFILGIFISLFAFLNWWSKK